MPHHSHSLNTQLSRSLPQTPVGPTTLLHPTDTCPSPVQISLASACLIPPPAKFAFSNDKLDRYALKPILPAPHPTQKFHWKAAVWQSFGFLVIGHAFRLANDSGARYLLFHKPFWHDNWASADNFHMSHWGDGDSFLVNYIGHPMEGAVAGDIFLNNDPHGRSARFGKSSNYWYSRLKAMAWATAFEAYFEIGPIFSEAAIGNEGGYTYVPGCGLYPCQRSRRWIRSNGAFWEAVRIATGKSLLSSDWSGTPGAFMGSYQLDMSRVYWDAMVTKRKMRSRQDLLEGR